MNPFVIRVSADELKLTTEFQHRISLSSINMKNFSARRAEKEPEVREGLELQLKHESRHTPVACGDTCFEVAMNISALADRDREKLVFQVECVFELAYKLAADFSPSEEQLQAFQRGNAVFLCWPYMREFVQNATSRLGLSVPPIPLLRTLPQATEAADHADTGSPAPPAGTERVKPRRERRRTSKR